MQFYHLLAERIERNIWMSQGSNLCEQTPQDAPWPLGHRIWYLIIQQCLTNNKTGWLLGLWATELWSLKTRRPREKSGLMGCLLTTLSRTKGIILTSCPRRVPRWRLARRWDPRAPAARTRSCRRRLWPVWPLGRLRVSGLSSNEASPGKTIEGVFLSLALNRENSSPTRASIRWAKSDTV